MKYNIILAVALCALIPSSHASNDHLQERRMGTVVQYLQDLKFANAAHMSTLFSPNGTVISTSAGKMNAINFFNQFLPNVLSATLDTNQVYYSVLDKDHLSARFHYTFQMKDGESVGAEYMDDFTFRKGSDKLENVYMFENTKAS